MEVDVAVIGSGPAGAVTALVLAKAGVRVVLVERAEKWPWKVGESLPPAAKPLLQQLGLWESFITEGHVPYYGNRSAWGSAELDDYDFIREPHGTGWHLDRCRFDAWLRAATVEVGAVYRTSSRVTHCLSLPGGWRLGLLHRRHEVFVDAKVVVDASGRASWFAKRGMVERLYYDRLIGIAGIFTLPTAEFDSDTRTLIEAMPEGWWYSAQIPENRLIVTFMTDADINTLSDCPAQATQRWQELLDQTEHTRRRVRHHSYHLTFELRTVSANSSRLVQFACSTSRWLAVGDAAAAHDPLSSQGICAAIGAAIIAAPAIQEYLDGKPTSLQNYDRRLQHAYDEYLLSKTSYYALEQRWPDAPFWQRRFVARSQ